MFLQLDAIKIKGVRVEIVFISSHRLSESAVRLSKQLGD